ncbi:MAG: HNH endonuclease [Bacteroidales bacterium]|nr:HNH endonuclease [Bacteroidales bacterium]
MIKKLKMTKKSLREIILAEGKSRCYVDDCYNTNVECHHIIPIRGKNKWNGPNEYLNLIGLCPNCHQKVTNMEHFNVLSKLELEKFIIGARKQFILGNVKIALKLFNLGAYTYFINHYYLESAKLLVESINCYRALGYNDYIMDLLNSLRWMENINEEGHLIINFPLSKTTFTSTKKIKSDFELSISLKKEKISFIQSKYFLFKKKITRKTLTENLLKQLKNIECRLDNNKYQNFYISTLTKLQLVDYKNYNKYKEILNSFNNLFYYGNSYLAGAWIKYKVQNNSIEAINDIEKGLSVSDKISNWTSGELSTLKGIILLEEFKNTTDGFPALLKGYRTLEINGINGISTASMWYDSEFLIKPYLKKYIDGNEMAEMIINNEELLYITHPEIYKGE